MIEPVKVRAGWEPRQAGVKDCGSYVELCEVPPCVLLAVKMSADGGQLWNLRKRYPRLDALKRAAKNRLKLRRERTVKHKVGVLHL